VKDEIIEYFNEQYGGKGDSIEYINISYKTDYEEIFENLIRYSRIPTNNPLISMFMAYDSSCVMSLTRKNDHLFNFRLYDLMENKFI
jgi:hypothetical protein